MEATGILHSKHTLVVIPDDPKLGEYREEFAGLIGTLQEHPSEGPDDTPGFAGSRKVSGTERLWEHLEESPCNRIDARAYLKARLMDFLIGDKDRHYGQWRWARFPDGDCHTYLPIPEDRDQAFIGFKGFAMAMARKRLPRQIEFGDKYPSLVGLSTTGWEMDREFLVELNKTGVGFGSNRSFAGTCQIRSLRMPCAEAPTAVLQDDWGSSYRSPQIAAGRIA